MYKNLKEWSKIYPRGNSRVGIKNSSQQHNTQLLPSILKKLKIYDQHVWLNVAKK